MGGSNSWAEFAGLFCATRSAFLDHERTKSELKILMPEDAKGTTGHGVRAKRSKFAGKIRPLFWISIQDILPPEATPHTFRRSSKFSIFNVSRIWDAPIHWRSASEL
jgi:hypothetical protein